MSSERLISCARSVRSINNKTKPKCLTCDKYPYRVRAVAFGYPLEVYQAHDQAQSFIF
jgi:hypothetical protein